LMDLQSCKMMNLLPISKEEILPVNVPSLLTRI